LIERFAHIPVNFSNNFSYIHSNDLTPLYWKAFCFQLRLSLMTRSDDPSIDSTYSWGYKTSLYPSSCAFLKSFSTSLAHVSAFCNNSHLLSQLVKFLCRITLNWACEHGLRRFTLLSFYIEILVLNHGCSKMECPDQAYWDGLEILRVRLVMNVDTIAFLTNMNSNIIVKLF
jgi:hypothetical protein